MDYNEIEQDKKRLDEISQLLFGEGGFFAGMPDDQKEAFGEGIRLLAKMQILETVGDFGKSGVSVGLNLDNFNIGEMLKNLIVIKPNMPVYDEPIAEPTSYVKPVCGACMCEPCMCAIEPVKCDPMSPKFYDCVNCGSTPCVCAPEYDPTQTALPLDEYDATMSGINTSRSDIDEYAYTTTGTTASAYYPMADDMKYVEEPIQYVDPMMNLPISGGTMDYTASGDTKM
jgi:hypothetical protein